MNNKNTDSILIKNITILDESSPYHGKIIDLYVKNGAIDQIQNNIESTNTEQHIIDGTNCYLCKSFTDIFTASGEPGNEHKENFTSLSQAAICGGYGNLMILPNNISATTNRSAVAYIQSKSNIVNFLPIGAISKSLQGSELAEMLDMHHAGAIAFSDGWYAIQNSGLLLKALQYIKTFKGTIITLADDHALSSFGYMHEGEISTKIGMQGKPAIAEHIHVYRNIELLKYTNSKLHITGVSTAKSLALIEKGKREGLQLTCSVTPYHLLYTENDLINYNTHFKVNPPLRSEQDRQALVEGIKNGIIDCIASHHAPQHWDDKQVEFMYAKYGMNTIQLVLPMLLKAIPEIPLQKWVYMLTTLPENIFSIQSANIDISYNKGLVIIDPMSQWTLDKDSNQSLSHNTPLFNTDIKGKILAHIHPKGTYIA